jgi:MFS family permease
LLTTLPVLGSALIVVIAVSLFVPAGILQALGSFLGLSIFICSFVTGFGPIPNILCSEIFPTRVRGIAIGITSGTMWLCNVIVSYAFPIANAKVGLVGVFLFFAVMSAIAWVFVYLKVPETKGLPLEIICEFFAMSGNQSTEARKDQNGGEEHEPLLKKV